jgi:cytoskeletal protein RodZ
MEKENIDAKDKEFRSKLKDIRKNLAMRQVKADQKESTPRNHFMVVIPVLMVLVVVVVYFGGKIMQSHQLVSAVTPDEPQITAHKNPTPPDQTESKRTSAETGIADGSKYPNDLIIDSEEKMPDLEIPLLALEDENGEFDFEMHVETDSEAGTESETKNHGSNYTIPSEDEDNEYLDSDADENAEANEIDEADSTAPSTSVTSPYGLRITQLLVCSGVKDRNCIVRQSDFVLRKGQKPHVWMEVFSNSVPYVLKHVYYREGRKYVEVPLKIKYPRMRTWSFITLKDLDQLGSWHVEIVAEDGTVLGRVEFNITNK